jgi:alanine dehydrogenase
MSDNVPVASIMNGKVSVPISALMVLFSGGLGVVATGSANLFSSGITATQVAEIVDDRLETKDEVLDIKLQTINEKLARIEAKLDQIQATSTP